MPEIIKLLCTRETSQQYFVIKVNGSDSTSNPSWNEGILLSEMIILRWKHSTFPLTIAIAWKFTPVLWRWNFTILTMNICFLWQKWKMFHPGAIVQVPMKILVFTQRYSQKENWRNRLSASQMKHQYEATYGKRILHSFLLKEKNIFSTIVLLKDRVQRVLCIHSLKVINVYYCKHLSLSL